MASALGLLGLGACLGLTLMYSIAPLEGRTRALWAPRDEPRAGEHLAPASRDWRAQLAMARLQLGTRRLEWEVRDAQGRLRLFEVTGVTERALVVRALDGERREIGPDAVAQHLWHRGRLRVGERIELAPRRWVVNRVSTRALADSVAQLVTQIDDPLGESTPWRLSDLRVSGRVQGRIWGEAGVSSRSRALRAEGKGVLVLDNADLHELRAARAWIDYGELRVWLPSEIGAPERVQVLTSAPW